MPVTTLGRIGMSLDAAQAQKILCAETGVTRTLPFPRTPHSLGVPKQEGQSCPQEPSKSSQNASQSVDRDTGTAATPTPAARSFRFPRKLDLWLPEIPEPSSTREGCLEQSSWRIPDLGATFQKLWNLQRAPPSSISNSEATRSLRYPPVLAPRTSLGALRTLDGSLEGLQSVAG
jgi:hypothetical protein